MLDQRPRRPDAHGRRHGLVGGVGGARFLQGLRQLLPEADWNVLGEGAADEALKLTTGDNPILPADSTVTYDRIGLTPAEQRIDGYWMGLSKRSFQVA